MKRNRFIQLSVRTRKVNRTDANAPLKASQSMPQAAGVMSAPVELSKRHVHR